MKLPLVFFLFILFQLYSPGSLQNANQSFFELPKFTFPPFEPFNLTGNVSIPRDLIAETIRTYDTSFKMLAKAAVKVSDIVEANRGIIGIFDARILPIVRVIIPILTNPSNKVITEYTLYGIWQVTPASANDKLRVSESNGNITVTRVNRNN